MLVRLLYASRAAEAVTHEIIEAILQSSRKHNPALGITGVLCHAGDVYMQVLEGGREAVNTLYNTIVRDERHRDIALLHYQALLLQLFQTLTLRHCIILQSFHLHAVPLIFLAPDLILNMSGLRH